MRNAEWGECGMKKTVNEMAHCIIIPHSEFRIPHSPHSAFRILQDWLSLTVLYPPLV